MAKKKTSKLQGINKANTDANTFIIMYGEKKSKPSSKKKSGAKK